MAAGDWKENGSINMSTAELWTSLFQSVSVKRFLDNHKRMRQLPDFADYISRLAREKKERPEGIIKRGGIESSYGHRLFSGTRKPSRDTVLQLAFGFGMNVEETQKLLKVARATALHPRVERDAVIAHCLQHHRSIMETQELLYENNLPLLGGKRAGS